MSNDSEEMRKKKAKLWRRLVEEAGEGLIEEASKVSVEQAEKELTEAGFDVKAERARAEAFLQELENAGEKVEPAKKG